MFIAKSTFIDLEIPYLKQSSSNISRDNFLCCSEHNVERYLDSFKKKNLARTEQ